MQHAHGAFRGDVGFALAGTNHQRADIQIVTRPARIQFDVEGFALGRHVDFFPPQRTVAAFNQQVAFACGGRCDGDFGRVAIGIRGFVQGQLDLIGTHRTAFGVVLCLIPGPESQAADQPGFRVLHFNPVRAPFHRETDFSRAACLEAHGFFAQIQKLLVVVIAPAIVVRVVPVVVTALTNQPHVDVIGRQFVARVVRNQHLEFSRAVAVGFSALKQTAHPRQAFGWPHRLHQSTGNGASARLLQTGLHDQLQRRFGVTPLAFKADGFFALRVEHAFIELKVLGQFLFGHRTKLIAGQGFNRFTQRTHIDLTTQAITGRRGAVQIAAIDLNLGGLIGAQRRIAALEFQRQAFGQEVFNQKLIELRLAVTQVKHQLPAPGRGFAGQLQRVLVETRCIRLPDKLAADLLVRATHFNTHRLWLDRVAITVAQQGVEQHGFARAIQITRAKHKKLQRVCLRAADVELGQVQRGGVQTQQAGLIALTRQQHLGLGRQCQLGMAVLAGLALGEHFAFAVEQFQRHVA